MTGSSYLYWHLKLWPFDSIPNDSFSCLCLTVTRRTRWTVLRGAESWRQGCFNEFNAAATINQAPGTSSSSHGGFEAIIGYSTSMTDSGALTMLSSSTVAADGAAAVDLRPYSTTRTPATDMLFITPPTNELTTILQLVVQRICHIAMPEPNILTCQDVGMRQEFLQGISGSCKPCTSYDRDVRLSVRPSVRPSHADIVWKRRKLGSRSLHRRIAQGL